MMIRIASLLMVVAMGAITSQMTNQRFRWPWSGRNANERLTSRIRPHQISELDKLNRQLIEEPENADLYTRRGLLYLAVGEHTSALADFQHAQDLAPTDASVYHHLGLAYYKRRDFPAAIKAFSQAIELRPDYASAYYQRGLVHQRLDAYAQARQDYEQALALRPDDSQAALTRLILLIENKAYQEAINGLNQLLMQDESCLSLDQIYFWRGQAYTGLHQLEKAIQDYSHALMLKPHDPMILNHRGVAYARSKRLSLAIRDYDQAIELRSDDPAFYTNRGETYYLLQRFPEAIADYERALELDPTLSLTYYSCGNAYRVLKNYPLALESYQRTLELEPDLMKVYADRGYVYQQLQRYPEALQDYARALEAPLKNPAAIHFNRGQLYLRLRQPEQAVADFDVVLNHHPNFAWAYHYRGMAYLQLGQLEPARNDCFRSRELNPKQINFSCVALWIEICDEEMPPPTLAEQTEALAQFAPRQKFAYVCRGIAYWQRGMGPEALKELEKAHALGLQHWGTYFWDALICGSLGLDAEACTALKRALDLGLPKLLRGPLRWLERERPTFYVQEFAPLLRD